MYKILILLLSFFFLFCKEKGGRTINTINIKDTIVFDQNKDIIVAVTLSELEFESKKDIEGLDESIADFRFYFNKVASKLKKCNIVFFITASQYMKIGNKVIDKKEIGADSFYILIKKNGKINILNDSYTDLDLLNVLKKEYNLNSCLSNE